MFNCQVCHGSYSFKYSLNQQMKAHEDSTSFKCDVCLKYFVSKLLLKTHNRTHTGEKPFACQVCKRKFAFKCVLVQHQATHSEIKPFKCSICPEGKFFKTKNQLSRHMVYHSKPTFPCNYCEHKSYTSGDLKRHEQNHFRK